MSRSTSFSKNHPYAKTRGWVSPTRAANSLPTVSDGAGNEVNNASEILVLGGTVSEPEDGVAQISFGGLAQSSNTGVVGGGVVGPGSAGTPVYMRNNGSFGLIKGDVVIVDENADSAVVTTSTASNTRIAGVVQAPIGVAEYGPVLFNGFTDTINTVSSVTRGDYALTSATAARAGATDSRVAGSFAVYLTGTDMADFATASVTTELDIPGTSLDIEMPDPTIAGRVLFLALWLETGITGVTLADWTLIGSEANFNYFYKVSEGDDTAEASWTGASVAVATVLLLHPNVSLASPIASHDYDTSTSAATVSISSTPATFAVAGVRAAATPGSGFVRLGGGTAGIAASSGTPALVQSKVGYNTATFDSTLTTGNLMVAVPFTTNVGDTHSTDPRQGGTCPPDANMTSFGSANTNFFSQGGRNAIAMLGKVVTSDTYSGPFGTPSNCFSNESELVLMEFENIGPGDYEVLTGQDGNSSPVDLGTFSVGADDLVVMAVGWKQDGYGGSPDPVVLTTGWTQIHDAYSIINGWEWVGYKIGDGDALVDYTNFVGDWAAVAVKFTQAGASVSGTLAGKYLGHVTSATSPFTGAGAQSDAVFAFNLLQDAKASALLYGPDLGAGSGSEPTADAHIADTSDAHDASAVSLLDSAALFTATEVEAAIAELATKAIGYTAHGNMGATETFSALTGWHSGTFDANCTCTFSGATSGIVASMVLELTENGTGGFSPTWPGSVVWPGGVTPTHTMTAGTTTLYLFQSRDGGTTWYGFQAGAGAAVGDLDDLSDVTITSPAADEQLQYVGGVWVNNARRWEPVTTNPGSGPEIVFDGDDIVMTWVEY